MASKFPVKSVLRSGIFEGKSAIVTGGSTGIGKAIATELVHLGCKVMIASRNTERLKTFSEALSATITQQGSPACIKAMPCNIRVEEQVKALMQETISQFGSIDFLVNNGGGQFACPIADMRTKGWHAVIDTNLYGTFYCLKEAYHTWMKDNGGSIVNIVVAGHNGFPLMAHSGAARAGIENLTKSLSIEWANSGININCVAPGVIYSETAAANYPNSEELFKGRIPAIPAKRLGTPEEVSSLVCFLLTPAAKYITGQTVCTDGGVSIGSPMYPVQDHNKTKAYTWTDSDDQQSKL